MELLWGARRRGGRGPKPRLTPAQITAAAIGIADAEGLAALSMRRVAERLGGVTAMSLYTYVPGKAELLDLMVDTVYAETAGAGLPAGWRAALAAVARQNRALYLRHPWLLQIALARPVLGPNLIAKYDRELRVIDALGLDDIEMDQVVTLLADYVHGAARAAIEAAQAQRRTGMTDEQWWSAHAPLLAEVLDPGRFPTAARVGTAAGEAYGAATDPARAFEFGLGRLLDGVEVLVRARSGGQPAGGK
jgi:AcrR family transcriptional regulator